MQALPIGIQTFEMLRADDFIYVDKTGILVKLIKEGRRYFLSRPRRFGKSLTLSTLEAMFMGESFLFKGLAAEEWVIGQSKNPSPVIRFDVSSLGRYSNGEELNHSIIRGLEEVVKDYNLQIGAEAKSDDMLHRIIRALYKKAGSVVVLIDEYDKPILDNINDSGRVCEIREVLRSFYTVLKSCDKYLRFVFITGISRFSKVGVFSAMNNLLDISFMETYGDIAGYTQQELEQNFADWINFTAEKMKISSSEILSRLKNYYDGFSFDGITKLYNPFSILNFFAAGEFGNYWYESGSPSFIVNWMKEHQIEEPEQYRHIQVRKDFTSSQEIENADPANFLYQSGYLTIEKKEEQILTLDYPNKEVLDALSGMYLELVYNVKQFASIGTDIWKALRVPDIPEVVRLYNVALSVIPYDDFPNRNEFWYRSLFLMLIRGAGIIAYAEVHTRHGRSDVAIQFQNNIIVLEFKFASRTSEVEQMYMKGLEQVQNREYAKGYKSAGCKTVTAVLVADDEKLRLFFEPER